MCLFSLFNFPHICRTGEVIQNPYNLYSAINSVSAWLPICHCQKWPILYISKGSLSLLQYQQRFGINKSNLYQKTVTTGIPVAALFEH